MKSNRLEKIDNFARRHPLLSSFLCLYILSAILEFFLFYADTAKASTLGGGIENIILSARLSIFYNWLWIIPIFFISLLLCSFLKKKSSHDGSLSFSRKFFLAFIPALATILFFSIWIVQMIPRPYASNPMYLYPLAIFTSCFYSAVFSTFFGWQSKVSRVGIIVQAIIVSLLMGIFYVFFFALSYISF